MGGTRILPSPLPPCFVCPWTVVSWYPFRIRVTMQNSWVLHFVVLGVRSPFCCMLYLVGVLPPGTEVALLIDTSTFQARMLTTVRMHICIYQVQGTTGNCYLVLTGIAGYLVQTGINRCRSYGARIHNRQYTLLRSARY